MPEIILPDNEELKFTSSESCNGITDEPKKNGGVWLLFNSKLSEGSNLPFLDETSASDILGLYSSIFMDSYFLQPFLLRLRLIAS